MIITQPALLSSPCYAAYFEVLSVEHGLSQGSVFDIAQDNHGFLWIGTLDGLNRYDGIKFIHFKDIQKNPDSSSALTGARIDHLTADQDGNLWASTPNGLNFFNTTTFEVKRYTHDPNNPHSLPNNYVRKIQIDSKGMLWIGTDIGLAFFNPKTQKFKLIQKNYTTDSPYTCSKVMRHVAIDSNDMIWVGTRGGLCKYNPSTEKFTAINFKNDIEGSASSDITELSNRNKDDLWIGTSKGLFKYQIKTGQSIAYYHKPGDDKSIVSNWISALAESDSNQLWVGTPTGLSLLDISSNTCTNFKSNQDNKNSLSNNNIIALNIDHSGLVLIGTNGGGLNIYNPRQQAFKHINKNSKKDYSLSDPAIWEITKAYGYTWIGTADGLNRIDPITGTIKQYKPNPNSKNSLPHQNVMEIDAGNNRDLWIATWDGISHFTIDDERFENYHKQLNKPETVPLQNIIALYYDKADDLVWIGSYGQGVTILDPKTNEFTLLTHDPANTNSIRNNYISLIHKRADGIIWISTREGISRYNRETDTFIHLDDHGIGVGYYSYSILELQHDKLIITSMTGLSIINSKTDELIKHYTKQDGLEDDFTYGAELDKQGHVWVSTNFGLSRINLETNEIKNFNVLDGLQGYEFNGDASYNDGEYLYFGGYNGVNYFKPEEIDTSGFIPPIVITGFSVHNKPLIPYLITKPIELTYKDDFFSIEFAALDFTHPKKNQYAYMLEGFDQEWVHSKNRHFASYTNLDGGEYIFRIKAANKYGVWNEQGISLPITITPPFWETTWFRITFIVSLIFIIFSIYTLRVRAIQTRNKLLKQQVKERTEDLENTLLELGETKDALIDAAHKAGMADTATAVLHNVGNLLNSVTTSAGLIRDGIASSVSKKFLKINKLLTDNQQNLIEFLDKDPKGKKLMEYLIALGPIFEKENSNLNENSIRLTQKIESIKDTISAQQRFVQQGGGFVEQLSLVDIVEESLLLQTGSIGRHEIKIIRHFEDDIPLVNVQKTKLVQILINLYKNAKESMDASASTENILTIDVSADQDYAYIRYTDTGLGIEDEKLEKVFSHGYTTKVGGHGFGLHSCANYMTEMRGKMWAESEGRNKGATFVLQFPLSVGKSQSNTSVSAA